MPEAATNKNEPDSMEEIAPEKDEVALEEGVAEMEQPVDSGEGNEAELDNLFDSMDDLGEHLDDELNDLLGEGQNQEIENQVEDLISGSDPAASFVEFAEDLGSDEETLVQKAPVSETEEKAGETAAASAEVDDAEQDDALLDEEKNQTQGEDPFGALPTNEQLDEYQDPDTELLNTHGIPDTKEAQFSSSEMPVSPNDEEKEAASASVIPLHQGSVEDGEPVLGVPGFNSDPEKANIRNGGIIGFVAIVVAMIALSFGVFGMWLINGIDGELKRLTSAVAEVSTTAETESLKKAEMKNALTSIGLINARLDEMGLQIAGMRTDAVKRQIDFEESVRERMEQMQQKVAALETSRTAPESQKTLVNRSKAALVEQAVTKRKVKTVLKPVPPTDPDWVVNLGTYSVKKQAASEASRLQKQGVKAEMFPYHNKGRTLYRLGVGGFTSYEKAKAYARSLQQKEGFSGAWVGKAG